MELVRIKDENNLLKARCMELESQMNMQQYNPEYEVKMERLVREYLEKIETLKSENEQLVSKSVLESVFMASAQRHGK